LKNSFKIALKKCAIYSREMFFVWTVIDHHFWYPIIRLHTYFKII